MCWPGFCTTYLDDFFIFASPFTDEGCLFFDTMLRILADVQVLVASNKLEGPSTTVTFLGIIINTARLELRLLRGISWLIWGPWLPDDQPVDLVVAKSLVKVWSCPPVTQDRVMLWVAFAPGLLASYVWGSLPSLHQLQPLIRCCRFLMLG